MSEAKGFVMAARTQRALEYIERERQRQNKKWGVQNHSQEHWLTILVEEVGEIAKAIYDGDKENYREELIQTAAVAVAMIEAFDANT